MEDCERLNYWCNRHKRDISLCEAAAELERPNTKIITRYLHSNEEELSELWPADAEQQKTYGYSLYEVGFDLEVDLDTGKSRIIAVDGVELKEKGRFK